MGLDSLEVVAKIFGLGGALCLVVAAAAVTALRVLRSDNSLDGVIARVQEEREYLNRQLASEREDRARERAEDAKERAELRASLDAAAEEGKRERAALKAQNEQLIAELQELRQQLTHYTLQQGDRP